MQVTALGFASNKPESMTYKAVILATAASALQAPRPRAAPRAAAVSAIAPAPVWVAGSILGGAAGTPFVVNRVEIISGTPHASNATLSP